MATADCLLVLEELRSFKDMTVLTASVTLATLHFIDVVAANHDTEASTQVSRPGAAIWFKLVRATCAASPACSKMHAPCRITLTFIAKQNIEEKVHWQSDDVFAHFASQ